MQIPNFQAESKILIATCQFSRPLSSGWRVMKGQRWKERLTEREGNSMERVGSRKIDDRSCLSTLTWFVPSVNFWLQYRRHVSLHGHAMEARQNVRENGRRLCDSQSAPSALVFFLPLISSLFTRLPIFSSFHFLVLCFFFFGLGRFTSSSVKISQDRDCIVERTEATRRRDGENNGVHKFQKIVSATLQLQDKRDGG